MPEALVKVTQIAGRWARLGDEFVTPVPPFHEFGYDE
jgi:hypothetical protein